MEEKLAFGRCHGNTKKILLTTPLLVGCTLEKVSELINPNRSCWNLNLLNLTFNQTDAKAISLIPIAVSPNFNINRCGIAPHWGGSLLNRLQGGNKN